MSAADDPSNNNNNNKRARQHASSSGQQDNVADDDDDDEGRRAYLSKRFRSMEPDVQVIVGGKSFYHYSILLCNASDYFDVMLGTDFKEGLTKVIEFPNKDPDEWEQVYRFIAEPVAALNDLDLTKIRKLLPWFSELCMTEWIHRCDTLYADCMKSIAVKQNEIVRVLDECNPMLAEWKEANRRVKDVLAKLERSVTYHLESSIKVGIEFFKFILNDRPYVLDARSFARIVAILKDETARDLLWPVITSRLPLPTKFRDTDPAILVDNPLLEVVLHEKAKVLQEKAKVQQQKAKVQHEKAKVRQEKAEVENLQYQLLDARGY